MLSARDITKLCFFVCIFCVLAVNGGRTINYNYEVINEGIVLNTKQTKARNDLLLEAFRNKAKLPWSKERITPFLERAEIIRLRTDALFENMEHIKVSLSAKPTTNRQSLSIPSQIGKRVLDSLKHSLDAHFELMASMIGVETFKETFISRALLPWKDSLIFNDKDPDAAICVMSMLQQDIYYNEGIVVEQLYREAGDIQIGPCMDGLAIAVPMTPYVVPGQTVHAIIGFMNYTYRRNPVYTLNMGKITEVVNTVATWKGAATSLGLNSVSGVASLAFETDSIYKHFSFQYFVAAPGISLNFDNANICYIGVNNPITISVPCFEKEKLSLKVKGATVSQTAPGKFNIFFNKLPKEDVYAFVEGTNKEGVTSTVASLPLKVVYLPTPKAEVAGVRNGEIPLRHFRKAEGISATLADSDFEMDYEVVSYKLSLLYDNNSMYIKPVDGKGPYFRISAAVMKILNIARRGDRAIFEEIIAKDENGRMIELAPMILKLY